MKWRNSLLFSLWRFLIGLLRPVGNVMARRQMAFESKVEQSNCFPSNLIFHCRVKLLTILRIFSKSKTSFLKYPKTYHWICHRITRSIVVKLPRLLQKRHRQKLKTNLSNRLSKFPPIWSQRLRAKARAAHIIPGRIP